jgi:hypothetical protein
VYHPEVINEYLSQVQPVVLMQKKSGVKEIPFELEYHSPEQVAQANDAFDNIIDIDLYKKTCETSNVKIIPKNPNIKLSVEELMWMENERILCKWDANYYLTRYYKHLDAEGVYRQFVPLIPQRVNMRILARLQKAQRAIRKLTLKARQQGETTWSQGIIGHRVLYFPDVVSMIASLDADSSAKLAKMFTDGINRVPYWNRPRLKSFNSGEEYLFENNSWFDLGWGTQTSLGRGRTPLLAHLSEIPFYKFPEKSIEDALFNAMHESIWMVQLLEGTAEVRDDYYHKKVKETISGMEAGTTSMVFCFHPWCARRDLFPTEAWLRARSNLYETWTPSPETTAHATKLRNWVLKNQDYREEFGSNWRLSREQMFYYEVEKKAAIERNALQAFLKEKPSDPEEAFQHAGQTIYPIQTIIEISDRAQSVVPEVYKLRGDPNEVAPEFWPEQSEIKWDGKIINIRANWSSGIPFSDFELVEINFNGWDNFDPCNKFLIWEHPKYNVEYGAAVDTSDGLGRLVSDDAIVEIIKKGTIEYKDKQVCEFASPELPQNIMWPWVLAISTYYSPDEQLLFAPEINKGTELLNAMQNRGWSNIFAMLDMAKLSRGITQGTKFGFETNPRNRNDLVNHMNSFIKGSWVEIYSMELIKELKDLVKKRTVSPVIGAVNEKILGKHDNRFMAFGICLYALHRDEILGLQKAAWEERVKNENSKVFLKSFQPDNYSSDFDNFNSYERDYLLEQFDEELDEVFADEGY